jgi:TRAP-type mannitol/chloroaromatic compound transport system permease large subunit
MLALVAFPSMPGKGYDKTITCGHACAGDMLGQLIPPSFPLVIHGPTALVSVAKLFMGAFIPGFILSALYCIRVTGRCRLNPQLAPIVSP